ncbi:MAG: VOC family protein [bacterium]
MDILVNALDHLVYATPDLEATVAELEERLGVRAALGGRHPGRGTRNALIALSDFSYLEVVGPDPSQSGTPNPRWFGVDTLTAPRLVTWAAKSDDIDAAAARAARRGVLLGPIASGSRQRADGVVLSWRFTDPGVMVEDGLVPFLIDWGTSPHPAASAPRGAVLRLLRAEHPDPERLGRALAALDLTLPIARGTHPCLVATLGTTRGDVELG